MYFIFVYKSLYTRSSSRFYLVNETLKPNIFLWQTFYLKKFNKLEAEPSQEELAELKRQKKLANKVSDYFFFFEQCMNLGFGEAKKTSEMGIYKRKQGS